MSLKFNVMISKGLQRGAIAAALGLGILSGLAEAAPIAPGAIQSEGIAAPIEKTVVVHHRRRPVVVHHHRRRQVCWWSHGRRVCRWR